MVINIYPKWIFFLVFFNYILIGSYLNAFMNRIKEILKEQGRSQAWLADKLDMSYMAVTRYCNNKRQPTIDTLNRIAELLEVDNRDLLVPLKPNSN